MKRSDVFQSDYLKADEVSGKGEEYTVTGVEVIEFADQDGEGDNKKPVMSFQETKKKLALNRTNWDRMAQAHGEDSDGWTGKKITLRLEAVSFKGKMFDSIRILA